MCVSLQRNGRREELLAGPSLYGVSVSMLTVLYWQRPEGIAAVACLCVGDGCAEVVGQRIGRHKLPHNQDKVRPRLNCIFCLRLQLMSFTPQMQSYEGTAACFFGGFFGTAGLLLFQQRHGLPAASGAAWLGAAAAAAAAAGAVESLPLGDFDNATVPVAAAMGMHLLMPAVT